LEQTRRSPLHLVPTVTLLLSDIEHKQRANATIVVQLYVSTTTSIQLQIRSVCIHIWLTQSQKS